ncbi:MAG: TetR/AcrR family transcriptional regulator, partial [Roseovarius sp.]
MAGQAARRKDEGGEAERAPLVGHVKVTREDWLNLARDVLVSDGVADLKVLSLSRKLEVSRSSFY